MGKILEVKNISKKYQSKEGEVVAIQNVNFRVNKGEFVSIIGPSRMWKIYTSFYHLRTRRKINGRNIHRRRKSRRQFNKTWIYATKRLSIRMENNFAK